MLLNAILTILLRYLGEQNAGGENLYQLTATTQRWVCIRPRLYHATLPPAHALTTNQNFPLYLPRKL